MDKLFGEVRKRLIEQKEETATWDGQAWKAKVRLVFEFDGWTEAIRWMDGVDDALRQAA
ncbi:MAG: hypothetical protein LN413_05735 [Candidatus Thermoplasmatota archaeon]|nr:hypothetical protein [Candidatus Thermoplasmatota archaeon]